MFEFVKNIFKPRFTWKYIDLDHGLVEEIRQVYLNNLPDYSDGTYFVQKLDIKLPLIKGKQVAAACLIYIPGNNEDRFAHKDPLDLTPSTYALNIPLVNCENSRTLLYKDKDIVVLPTQLGESDRRSKVPALVEMQATSKVKPFTSYVLDKPILFNTQVLHVVKNYSSEPRLAISLRFAKNPVEWI